MGHRKIIREMGLCNHLQESVHWQLELLKNNLTPHMFSVTVLLFGFINTICSSSNIFSVIPELKSAQY